MILLSQLAGKLPRRFYRVRIFLYRKSKLNFTQLEIRNNVFFDKPKQVYLGNNCFINRGVEFHIGDGIEKIIIGDNVMIGPNSCFFCVSHHIGPSSKRAGQNKYGGIVVGEGVWIGANVSILAGVTIAEGCIVGAGSVVVNDTKTNGLYAGNPARRIKDLN